MSDRVRDFVSQMYDYARQAGLPDHVARVAVAQAALETGFGRSVKGNNYHGIKAGRGWGGQTQNLRTWEEVGGKRQNITDRFRAYDSPVQSFRDWAGLVANRFPGVLTGRNFAESIEGLRYGKPGGYATDSKYGTKLASINNMIDRYAAPAMATAPIPTPAPRSNPNAYAGLTRSLAPVATPTMAAFSAPVGPVQREALPPIAAIEQVAPQQQPATQPLDRRAIDAYQYYGLTRSLAPANPVGTIPPVAPPVPAAMPPVAPPPVPAPPAYQAPQPVSPVPSAPSMPTGREAIQGLFDAPAGSQARPSWEPDTTFTAMPGGRVEMTNKYGYTRDVTQDWGRQPTGPAQAPGATRQGGFLGIPQAQTNLGSNVRGIAGSVGGAALGGLLGPIGSMVGGMLGNSLARGVNPFSTQQNQPRGLLDFAAAMQNFTPGLGFPDAPNAPGLLGGNPSFDAMSGISPAAAAAISDGRVGLY